MLQQFVRQSVRRIELWKIPNRSYNQVTTRGDWRNGVSVTVQPSRPSAVQTSRCKATAVRGKPAPAAVPQLTFNDRLNQLKEDANRSKKVPAERLKNLITRIKDNNLPIQDRLFLLRCCALVKNRDDVGKQQLVDLLWRALMAKENATDEEILTLIQVYRACNKQIEDWPAFLTTFDRPHDARISEELMCLACENGQFSESTELLLNELKARELPVNERYFAALIRGHSKAGNLDKCERLLETMNAVNVSATWKTSKEMTVAYIESKQWEKEYGLIESIIIVAFAQHGTEKQLRKLLLTRPFDVDQLKKHVANLSDEGQVTALLKLAKCSDGFHVDFQQGFIYEMLLERHVRQNDCAGALQLFEEITQGEGKVKLTSKFVSDLKDLLKMNKMEVPAKILLRKF